ncbi:MAG: preprotein translocase subunit YajC [Gemmatimonadales bacterium]|nr:preprotein translocase subunit YajC [Gemmatimonadales bacterium]
MARPIHEQGVEVNVFAMFQPSGQQGGGTMVVFVLQIAAFIGIFWFLLIRPQRQQAKKHAALLTQLKKGDEIVTAGGVVGEIVHIKDDRLTIKSGEAKLVVERERVTRVITKTEEKAAS